MQTQNINVKTAASESRETGASNPEQWVFICRASAEIYSVALQGQGQGQGGEAVSMYGFNTLAELQVRYPDMALMRESDAHAMQDAKFCQPWDEITAECFIDQLEVLPPLDWVQTPAGESFKFREMYAGEITTIFVRVGQRYFRCRDRCTQYHDDLVRDVVSTFLETERPADHDDDMSEYLKPYGGDEEAYLRRLSGYEDVF